jgi:hypothetical protein
MRILLSLIIAGLMLAGSGIPVSAQDDSVTYVGSAWVGGHYTNFSGYPYKVAQYQLITDQPIPELRLDLKAWKGDKLFLFDGHYFDRYNGRADLKGNWSDRLAVSAHYRSLVHNRGRDLLENLSAREYVGGGLVPDASTADPTDSIEAGGGKMITHELDDDPVEYRNKRYEASSDLSLLITRTGNLRLIAAHRSIIERGYEQKIAVMHCFSCHVVSKTAPIDRQTHQIQAGLEGEAKAFDFGYLFGYRTFKSDAAAPELFYDTAMHPVNGGARPEFNSREIYNGEMLMYGEYPDIEKMSHKVRMKGDVGSGRLASSFVYSTTENTQHNYAGTNLKTESYGGNINYTVPLSPRARLIAKASARRVKNTDPFIDLPTWRDYPGSAGPQTDFDFTRYSGLDRKAADGSVEVISRLNRKTIMSVATGVGYVSRLDYPDRDAEYATTTVFGEIGMKYRDGLKYGFRGKYRYEKTDDPFISGRGLFEQRGREELEQPYPGFPFIFYFQREDLRYQDITTVPTDRHELNMTATYRAGSNIHVDAGFKTTYDKNGELDSIDVDRFMWQPNLSVTVVPNPKWTFSGGGSYSYFRSRGPITVALFDG